MRSYQGASPMLNTARRAMLGIMGVDANSGVISARVRLAKIDAEVSRLGFGTSALMSRVNRRDSLRLLGTAFEHGITHFDTARSYGFGEAESVLGEFVESRREELTVTTKVGILPPHRAPWLSSAKAAARALLSIMPSARQHVRQGAGLLLPAPRFDTAALTASLETSLRALRTDYVDFLLLHEPRMEVLRSGEPLAFLQRARDQGKVRFAGVATDGPGVLCVLSEMPQYAPLLQQPYNVFSQANKKGELPSRGAVMVHSCFGTRLEKLRVLVSADPVIREEWNRRVKMDIMQPGMLARLTLQATVGDLPHSAILFTSTKPQHIRENAAALGAAALVEQVEQFRELVSTALPED